MKRMIGIALVVVAIATPLGAGGVLAAKPAHQACVGQSASGAAQALGADYGHAIVGFAQDPADRPGLGDGVQALQAGFVSDGDFPNTCND